jgi:uncharacterized LabA/DUF88 family protein
MLRLGWIEKGVDTAIVTDMLRLGWEDAWEVAMLVSSDTDFIPAVEVLRARGLTVVQAGFPPRRMLAQACAGTVDMSSRYRAVMGRCDCSGAFGHSL